MLSLLSFAERNLIVLVSQAREVQLDHIERGSENLMGIIYSYLNCCIGEVLGVGR